MANFKTRSPALKLCYTILSDGKDHTFAELLKLCAQLIPEEEAERVYIDYRRRGLLQRNPNADLSTIANLPREDRIAIGRREKFRNTVSSARHIGIKIVNGQKVCYYHENALGDPKHRPTRDASRQVAAGRPPSVELEKAYELLADGQWHTYEEVIVVAARAIAPGRALRHRERVNELMRKRNAAKQAEAAKRGEPMKPTRKAGVRPTKDIDSQIWSGKRDVARRSIRSSKKIIHYKDARGHWVRLARPGEESQKGS